jgi:hypothetical protein
MRRHRAGGAAVSSASAPLAAHISVDADATAPGVQSAATYQLGLPTIPIDIVVGNADMIGAFEFQCSST